MGTLVSSTNRTDHHVTAEILLKVTLNTITPPPLLGFEAGLDSLLQRKHFLIFTTSVYVKHEFEILDDNVLEYSSFLSFFYFFITN